jgi:hypothetical protein
MDEIVVNTAFTFSKKEVLKFGLQKALEPSIHSLMHKAEDKLVDLVSGQLQDDGNCYQFVLTVKKIDSDPELDAEKDE